MIKIIDGKRYNTTTATKIGGDWNGLSISDFNYCSETLYQTKKGQYFLHGDGGAMSRYSKCCGGSCCGSTDIVLLTPHEALAWASEHLDETEMEHFEAMIEEG